MCLLSFVSYIELLQLQVFADRIFNFSRFYMAEAGFQDSASHNEQIFACKILKSQDSSNKILKTMKESKILTYHVWGAGEYWIQDHIVFLQFIQH